MKIVECHNNSFVFHLNKNNNEIKILQKEDLVVRSIYFQPIRFLDLKGPWSEVLEFHVLVLYFVVHRHSHYYTDHPRYK